MKLPSGAFPEDLQDGMLLHYLEQAAASDANVEAKVAKEPYDWRKAHNEDKSRWARSRTELRENLKKDALES